MSSEYLYVDSVEKNGNVYVWVRGDNGLEVHTYDSRDYFYCFIPNNSGSKSHYKDLWGTPMKQCKFNTKRDLREFAMSEKYVCESDIPTKYKVLIDELSDASPHASFNFCLYDIEVDFDLTEGKGYPKPENPYGEINAISCFDNYRNRYTIFAFDKLRGQLKLEDDEYPVKIVWCYGERDLLQKFANYLDPIDVFAGWFSEGFDLPYLMARAEKNFGSQEALKLFCRDGFDARSTDYVNAYGEEKVKWQTIGRKHIDLLEIYKKFKPGQRTSYKLDSICEEDLGENKIQYEDEGDLGVLYRENPQKFFEYSLHDSRLLVKLDRKHNLMKTAMMIAVSSFAFVDDVTGSVKVIEQGFNHFCKAKNIVLPDKKDHDKEKFPGAIVYHTITGRHGWSMSIDLGSLYPSTMVMLGLSPETMVGQLAGGYDDYVSVMGRKDETVIFHEYDNQGNIDETYEVNAIDMNNAIKESGYTVSAHGTVFNGELGLFSEYINEQLKERKRVKKLAAQKFQEGDMFLYEMNDLLQNVLKVKANSAYGCLTNIHFRLFNINLAASITLTGQMISKIQAVKVNETIETLKELE